MPFPFIGIALAGSLAAPQILPLTSAPEASAALTTGYRPFTGAADRMSDVDAMLATLNAERLAKGLEPLALDDALSSLAYEHAADMVNRRYFDHNTPEGQSPFARMTGARISFDYAGENLALDSDVSSAARALWRSPEHRLNILGTHYARVGIAAVDGPDGEIFVEDFTN